MRSSTPHAPLGESSSLNPKPSPPSECATGLTSVRRYDPWYNLYIQGASARAIWRISGLRHTDSRVVYYSWRAGPWVVRAERGRGCEQSEAGAARVGQCVIRSEVSLFELVFVIAPTAGRNLAVSWSCTANGEGGTSGSLGKHEPRIDAAFARYVGPASLKPIPTLSREESVHWMRRPRPSGHPSAKTGLNGANIG